MYHVPRFFTADDLIDKYRGIFDQFLAFNCLGIVFGVHEDIVAADIAMKDADVIDESPMHCRPDVVIVYTPNT